ncbi:MAG: LysM peptidoglycan-binding domain-containing protein [Chloroflexi bacterium]|nr:LysM peptidoglycan-binding domain-containing protein [Chloroflexota bacterium]
MIRVGLLLALVLLLAGGLLNAPAAEAHPGDRDDNGCHTCQANCADYGIEDGFYHRHDPIRACDDGSSAEPPREPETGTTPGPEAGAAAEPQAGSQAPVAPIQPPPDGKHTVEPGDTLYGIANRYGLSAAELLALNPPLTLESIIQPGDVLVVAEGTEEEPAAVRLAPEATHTVEPGDTLYGIADRYGLSAAELLALNPELTLESIIHPGDVLVVAEAILEEPAPSLPEPAPAVESAASPEEPEPVTPAPVREPDTPTPEQQAAVSSQSDGSSGGMSGAVVAGVVATGVVLGAVAVGGWLLIRRKGHSVG